MSEVIAQFQNFAKLKDTKIAFNDITVLVGKPGTGKSYVMKSIYSIEESIILSLQDILKNNFKKYLGLSDNFDNKKLPKIPDNENLRNTSVNIKEVSNKMPANIKNLLRSVFTNLNQISNSFKLDYKEIHLFFEKDKLQTKINSINDISLKSNVIFVETPLILEFHKHLDKREAKTPYHIESLMSILDENYSFTDTEQDELIESFSTKANKIIGGNIKNSDGSFIFSRNNDEDYNIFNASSGIKSIGLLQYLVTNKALKKGSILFWEEPEVHLHPDWQLKMVDLFVELMNAGVKIVFSTHSPYMGDYLHAISKRKKFRDRVSFNALDEQDGIVTNHILNDNNWHILQDELMNSFEDILWKYL
ncbi:MAG: ATP-binding protein [Sulfurospirillum sp.]|nr:ATP-binding protein [Sulfurospirillum sp.]